MQQTNTQQDFLQGRTAIVTGAAGGIGRHITKALASLGIHPVLVGRNVRSLTDLKEELTGTFHVSPLILPGDLTDLSFVSSLPRQTVDVFGHLDIVINNAALAQHSAFTQVQPDFFDQVMATNVRAPFFLCQHALPYLRSSDAATIINICSVVAHKGYPMQSVYAASKHALLGLSKSLSNEVYQDNIRVHVISPGAVFTDMVAIARPDLTAEGMILPEDIAQIVAFYLMRRSSNAVIDEIEVRRTNKPPFA